MFRINYTRNLNNKLTSDKEHSALRKLILDKMLLFDNLYNNNTLISNSKDWNAVKHIIGDYSLLYGFSIQKFLAKNNDKLINIRKSHQWISLINSLNKELKTIENFKHFTKYDFKHYFNNINFSRKLISGNKIIHGKQIQPADNLRTQLGKLFLLVGCHCPLKFTGIFKRFGETRHINFPTILLENVSYCDCVEADHVWVLYNSKLNSLKNLKVGKKISFLANVVMYYKGANLGLYDYGLDNLRNIKILDNVKSLD